jgi:conjugal transfer pilus assembly protein TraI
MAFKSFYKSFMDILLARESEQIKPYDRSEQIAEYPTHPKGLPFVDPAKMLLEHNEHMRRIKDQAIATPEDFEKFYRPMILRFASFVQLLPASQAHHHHDQGGLFRHSLEVGHRALELADRVLLTGARTPRQRRELEPRWQFAVFAAALCHDGGKPIYDMTVSNYERTLAWKPLSEDLYTWGTKHKLNGCHIDWREGRGRQHTSLAILLMDRIITRESMEWVELSGMDLVTWLTESLTYNPGPQNLIHDLVIKADQFSVERNLKSIGVSVTEYGQFNIPTERYLIEVMKRLIKMGVWEINTPGSRVWKIDEYAYIVWPAGGEEMARETRTDGVPMAPRTADGILEFLVERELVIIRDNDQYLWEIVPDCIAAKIPNKSLFAIRLKSDALLSTFPIPPVAGHLKNDAPKIEQPYDKSVTHATSQNNATEQSPVATPDQKQEVAAERIDEQPQPGEQPEAQSKVVSSKPSKEQAKAKQDASDQADLANEILKAIAEDVHSGAKEWNVDIFKIEDHVILAWESAFTGYGISTTEILDTLAKNKMLYIEPLNPLKRILDIKVNATSIKAVKLDEETSASFLRVAESKTKSASKSKNVQSEADTRPAETPPIEQTETETAEMPPIALPERESEVAQTIPHDTNDDVLAHPPEKSPLDRVIDRLSCAVPPDTDDGWAQVPLTIFKTTLKNAGVTLTAIKQLAKDNPDRLQFMKDHVKFKI